ncbi:monomethylamine:corrinoid methyltransferase [Chloroflexota bacterium]
MSILRIVEMLERAHKGPVCPVKEWNIKVIPTNVAKKLKEYGLNGTYDAENPINTDDELADRFFKAGFELAVETGVLCQDTERVINVTADELRSAIKDAPSQLFVGKGVDEVLLKSRRPEDPYPAKGSAPTAVVVDEQLFTKYVEAMVQSREIDLLEGPTLTTVYGRKALSRTPFESLVGWYEAMLSKEALNRAGRSGMCKIGILSSPTEYGHLTGFGTAGGLDPEKDLSLVLSPGELTNSYEVYHKVIQSNACGGRVIINYGTMIGGYPGPIEGTVLCYIANALLTFAVNPVIHAAGVEVTDLRYLGGCGREGVWVHSAALQALSRNSHHLIWSMMSQVGGPGTDHLLYEDAVIYLMYSVSGGSGSFTTRSTGVKYPEYLTPLECKFSCEMLHKSAGMTREKANEIVKVLIPKYENNLRTPPKGKSFRELYNLDTLKPNKEYLDLYLKIKKELIDLGVPLDSNY